MVKMDTQHNICEMFEEWGISKMSRLDHGCEI
jgi:hypothetical protein